MNSEEHGLLTGLFNNLRGAEAQPRDPEVEQFICQAIQAQPSAPYYMAQAVVIQQQALAAAHTRIEELERRAREAEARAEAASAQAPQPHTPASGGSFLANALGLGKGGGAWGARAAPPPLPGQPSPLQGQPVSGQQPARNAWGLPNVGQPNAGSPGGPGRANAFGAQQQPGQPQRSGFLAGAMQTAAGVAGGMLVAGAISSMLNGGAEDSSGAGATTASTEPMGANAPEPDAGYQQANHQDDTGYGDGGFDDGGMDDGGDWA